MKHNLKVLRVSKGLKQKECANLIGITPQYLGLIEKGVVEPRRDVMIKISKVLNISVQEIFFNEKKGESL